MAKQYLTDAVVRHLAAPAKGYAITWDEEVAGFGCRVTATGAKSFVLDYRAAGRKHRPTIGSFPDWKTKAAREHAKGLKVRVDLGENPMADRHAERAAKTVNDLCDMFERDHLPSRRASTKEDYSSLIRLYVRPTLGTGKVYAVRRSEIASLHRDIASRAPYRANRLLAVISVMMEIAIEEGWRADNPTKGVEKAHEDRRERYLTSDEISRLTEALGKHHERASANAIFLLMLTGARRGEVLSATWDQFDLAGGVWVKPAASTKQKRSHRLPLSAAAVALLAGIRADAPEACTWVFPSTRTSHVERPGEAITYRPLTEIKRVWASLCKNADIRGVRLHDLRHTFASVLVSSGLSLVIVGRLLGHTQARTTDRYSHLADNPLRAATEIASAAIGRPKT